MLTILGLHNIIFVREVLQMLVDKQKMQMIKDGVYELTDEEIDEIYKMTAYVMNKFKIPQEDWEDCKQDLVMHFISYSLPRFDIDKGWKFSTFLMSCVSNACKMRLRKNSLRFNIKNAISFDKNADDELSLSDTVASKDRTPSQQYQYDFMVDTLRTELLKDELLHDLFGLGLKQHEIAKKRKLSQAQISKLLKKKIAKLKKQINYEEFDRDLF